MLFCFSPLQKAPRQSLRQMIRHIPSNVFSLNEGQTFLKGPDIKLKTKGRSALHSGPSSLKRLPYS